MGQIICCPASRNERGGKIAWSLASSRTKQSEKSNSYILTIQHFHKHQAESGMGPNQRLGQTEYWEAQCSNIRRSSTRGWAASEEFWSSLLQCPEHNPIQSWKSLKMLSNRSKRNIQIWVFEIVLNLTKFVFILCSGEIDLWREKAVGDHCSWQRTLGMTKRLKLDPDYWLWQSTLPSTTTVAHDKDKNNWSWRMILVKYL